MKLKYKILEQPGKRLVYFPHIPQTLDASELSQWMKETRDDNPDLYSQLVHVYILLTKPLPRSVSNTNSVHLPIFLRRRL
jgi:hypothetical protein